jgi:hypothetical protein
MNIKEKKEVVNMMNVDHVIVGAVVRHFLEPSAAQIILDEIDRQAFDLAVCRRVHNCLEMQDHGLLGRIN